MALFFLIRHGHNDSVGHKIVGRLPGVHLNATGREEAQRLSERLAHFPLTHIFSSPLERARQTAAPLGRRLELEVVVCEDLHEIDFGGWAGLSFEDLAKIPLWRRFNEFRSTTRPPGGELMTDVQARMVGCVERLREEYPHGAMALVGHGDPLKTVIAHYAGIPLDHMMRLELNPASISILAVHDHGPKILCVNSLDPLPPLPSP
jgi:broad specificity phosphatase PhoE